MAGTRTNGLYLEDFEVGRILLGPTRTITEADISAFANISGDHNPLHTDEDFAQTTRFGKRIAHGLLGLSIATGLVYQAGCLDGNTLAFTGLEWKFKAPVFIGDAITYRATVIKNRPIRATGGGMVILDVDVLNQEAQVVQTGKWSLLIKSKASA